MAVFSGQFDKVVIMLSTGRTGTMALAQCFDACYDDVRALHEPKPSRHLRLASNRHLAGKLSTDRLVELFARSRRALFEGIDEPIYIEANNFLHGFLDAFDRLFDAPQIVHIVRDPRTFLRSWINFGVFRGRKGLAGRFLPYWLLKPELLAGDDTPKWAHMPRPERIAWYWNAVNRELDRGAELFGERYRRMRYEDIFAPDSPALGELASWIDLPAREDLLLRSRRKKVNASRRDEFPRWDDWTPEWKDAVARHCGERMRAYGYDGESPGASPG